MSLLAPGITQVPTARGNNAFLVDGAWPTAATTLTPRSTGSLRRRSSSKQAEVTTVDQWSKDPG
jgi:hypothetical protein